MNLSVAFNSSSCKMVVWTCVLVASDMCVVVVLKQLTLHSANSLSTLVTWNHGRRRLPVVWGVVV